MENYSGVRFIQKYKKYDGCYMPLNLMNIILLQDAENILWNILLNLINFISSKYPNKS